LLIFDDDRASDSPFVERIWRSHSQNAGWFLSIAESRSEIVIAKHQGQSTVTVRGPETHATRVCYPPDTEWMGIRLKPGVRALPRRATTLVDHAIHLPTVSADIFRLNRSTWQVPDFEDADDFVDRLARDELLVLDPAVPEALSGDAARSSLRTLQRRFRYATGVSQSLARQIEHARYAVLLLTDGVPIPTAIHDAGYFDQPHLTRSLQRFIGQTPAQLRDACRAEQLSFLYQTQPFAKL